MLRRLEYTYIHIYEYIYILPFLSFFHHFPQFCFQFFACHFAKECFERRNKDEQQWQQQRKKNHENCGVDRKCEIRKKKCESSLILLHGTNKYLQTKKKYELVVHVELFSFALLIYAMRLLIYQSINKYTTILCSIQYTCNIRCIACHPPVMRG